MSNTVMDDRASVDSSADSVTATAPAISNPLVEQADKLKKLLFTKDTVVTLSQSIRLLVILFKESLVLLWLTLCWGIVAISWSGIKAAQTGQYLKQHWTAFQARHQDQTASDIAAETSKSVLDSSKTLVGQILTGAKKQVGLSDE